jgi:hypothetical protein
MPAPWRWRSSRDAGLSSSAMPARGAGIRGDAPSGVTAEKQVWVPGPSPGTTRATDLCCAMAAALMMAVSSPALAQAWAPRERPVEEALPPAADPGRDASAEIAAMILGQWRAFLAADGPAAFAYASPRLRETYRRPSNFMAMVEAEYGLVYRARALEPLDYVTYEGYLARRVAVTGPGGERATALYLLTRVADGSWRIAGCLLFRPAL